jgi:Arc/MetJ family transcription regulator
MLGVRHGGISLSLLWIPEESRMRCMKTTIDIPEKELQDAMEFTGARSKREAVVTALTEFNRRRRLERLVEKFGTLDGFMTQEELRRMREET